MSEESGARGPGFDAPKRGVVYRSMRDGIMEWWKHGMVGLKHGKKLILLNPVFHHPGRITCGNAGDLYPDPKDQISLAE